MTTSNEHNNAPAVQVYQLAKLGGPTETAWIDVTQEVYEDAGFYKDDFKRRILSATPAPAPAQERCSTCGYLTSEREHLGCLRRAVKDLDIATGGPYDAQGVGLTDEEIEAIAKKHMSTVGDHWCNEEAIREIHAEDFARAIIAALLAKWGQVMSALDARQHSTIAARGGPYVG